MKAHEVVKYFGGQAATSRALTKKGVIVSQPAIAVWIRNDAVPMLRQYQIQKITRGKLKIGDIKVAV